MEQLVDFCISGEQCAAISEEERPPPSGPLPAPGPFPWREAVLIRDRAVRLLPQVLIHQHIASLLDSMARSVYQPGREKRNMKNHGIKFYRRRSEGGKLPVEQAEGGSFFVQKIQEIR